MSQPKHSGGRSIIVINLQNGKQFLVLKNSYNPYKTHQK